MLDNNIYISFRKSEKEYSKHKKIAGEMASEVRKKCWQPFSQKILVQKLLIANILLQNCLFNLKKYSSPPTCPYINFGLATNMLNNFIKKNLRKILFFIIFRNKDFVI